MLEESKKVLSFLGFQDKHIIEINYLINMAEKLGCTATVRQSIDEFYNNNESFPVYIKSAFLHDFSWTVTELICAEYYPDIALSNLEDFCIFFQDIWLEDDTVFYAYFLKVDTTDKTKREIVEEFYEKNKNLYDSYLVEATEPEPFDINAIMNKIQSI